MAADKGPLHQFEISNLYEIRLENIDISFTNSALSMIISILVASVIFYLGSGKNPNIPGRLQVLVEMSMILWQAWLEIMWVIVEKFFFLSYLLYFCLFCLEIY